MQYKTIAELNIRYKQKGSATASKLFVFLHGWGGSLESFEHLSDTLSADFQCIIFDWPGFGESTPPITAWNTHKYADFFYKFLQSFDTSKQKEIILYGHSFGCRVLTRYMCEQNFNTKISTLIFTGAAGITLPLPWHKKIIKTVSQYTKPIKKLIPTCVQSIIRRKILRAHDWDATKGTMKQTFLNVISEPDFRNELSKINTKSLIIWGKNDTYTPLAAGYIFRDALPNVQSFTVLPNGRHGIHRTHPSDILHIIKQNI